MNTIEKHGRWAGAIQAAAAVLAAMPGIGALITGLAVPNDLRVIFGGFFASVGTIVVMLVWANRHSLQMRSSAWTLRMVAMSLVTAIVMFGAYQWLYRSTTLRVIDSRWEDPIELEYRFPIVGASALRDLVEEYGSGSRYEAIANYTPERMAERLQEPDIVLWLALSDLLLLVTFLLIASPLALALGVAGLATQRPAGGTAAQHQLAPAAEA